MNSRLSVLSIVCSSHSQQLSERKTKFHSSEILGGCRRLQILKYLPVITQKRLNDMFSQVSSNSSFTWNLRE